MALRPALSLRHCSSPSTFTASVLDPDWCRPVLSIDIEQSGGRLLLLRYFLSLIPQATFYLPPLLDPEGLWKLILPTRGVFGEV